MAVSNICECQPGLLYAFVVLVGVLFTAFSKAEGNGRF